jgi:hypothetical protein
VAFQLNRAIRDEFAKKFYSSVIFECVTELWMTSSTVGAALTICFAGFEV